MTLAEKVRRLKPLPQNWDSYGAEPLTQATIDFAASIADPFPDFYTVTVTNDGGIEFSNGDKSRWVTVRTEEQGDGE